MGRLTPQELNERKIALHTLNRLHNKVCGTCRFSNGSRKTAMCINPDTGIVGMDLERSTCGKWRGR